MTTSTRVICRRTFFAATLLTVSGFAYACGGESPIPLPGSPAGPTPPPVSYAAPTISSVTPSLGSTKGGTFLRITGTGFLAGVQVTFGSETVLANLDSRTPDTAYVTTPKHAAGSVDVVVTNPDRQTARAVAAYTFEVPESFNVDGDWEGGAYSGHELFEFTVKNGAVVSIACSTSGTVLLSPPAPVIEGDFSFLIKDQIEISGTFVSPAEAIGVVTVGPCKGADWYANKK